MRARVWVALILLPLLALGPANAAQARSCAGKKPTGLRFVRKAGDRAGVLKWRAPRRAPAGARYRVFRNRAVVGQTEGRHMRVNVRIGRRYRLSVALVSRRGRVSRCRSKLRVKITYRRPSRPRLLAVSDATRATARLTWEASRGGDAPVVAYRVYRGDVVYKQTRKPVASIRLSSKRRYRFSVAAVDRLGHLSRRSRYVTVVTGHKAPPAPMGLSAGGVTDSAVTLSWTQSPPPRGRVVGFRVHRDDDLVKQVKASPYTVANLAAATRYDFSVAAVDGLGYISEPSAPASVSTAMPPSTDGHAHAFLLASTFQSFIDLQSHYDQIGVIYPTYFDCTSDARLAGRDDPLVTGWAKLRRVQVLPRFNCQKGALLHRILTEPDLRESWLSSIVRLADEKGYDGANIDFEAGYAADRDLFTAFITDLAGRLHARGKKLSIAASPKVRDVMNHPRSTFFDYLALSEQADWIYVMCWGYYWSTSGPGAPDYLPWWKQVADYVATMPNKRRFVMGMPLYGMDWPNGGGTANPSTPREYADVRALIADHGGGPSYDANSDAYHYAYTQNGVRHDLWYPDADTEGTRIRIVQERGIGGVGFWRLGREDQRLWSNPVIAAAAL